jgi:hypothetical protein
MLTRRTGAQRRTHPRTVGVEVLEDRSLLSGIGSLPVKHPGHEATAPEVRGSAHAQDQQGADKHSLDHSDHGKDDNGREGDGEKHSSDREDHGNNGNDENDDGNHGNHGNHGNDDGNDNGNNDDTSQPVARLRAASAEASGSRPGDDTSEPVAHPATATAKANGASGPTSPGRLRAEPDTAEVNVAAPEDATPDAAAAGTFLDAASLNPSAVFLTPTGAPGVGVNAFPAEGQFAPQVYALAALAEQQARRWGPPGAGAGPDLQATADQALLDFSPGGLDAPADLLPGLLQLRADAPESLPEQLFNWAGGDRRRAWLPWVAGFTLSALALELARRQMKRAREDDPFLSPDFALVGWLPQAGGTERGRS